MCGSAAFLYRKTGASVGTAAGEMACSAHERLPCRARGLLHADIHDPWKQTQFAFLKYYGIVVKYDG